MKCKNILLTALLLGSFIYNPITKANEINTNIIAADNENKVYVTIETQEDLNNYLLKTGFNLSGDVINFKNNETITFPTGTYILNNDSYNDWFFHPNYTGDVDLNNSTILIGDAKFNWKFADNQMNRTVKNLTIYGSANVSNDYVLGNTRNGKTSGNKEGGFVADILLTQNLNLDNLTFNNAHIVDGHLFDVLGSDNIHFNNIVSRGYAINRNLTQEQLTEKLNKSSHTIISEAIQIDVSSKAGFGGHDLTNKNIGHLQLWWDKEYTNKASTNIKITNSRFTGYNGPTGSYLIDPNKGESNIQLFGGMIGSHSASPNSGYENIILDNIQMEDTIQIENSNLKDFAPIKFLIVDWAEISNKHGNDYNNAVTNSISYNLSSISGSNLKFVNTKTSNYNGINGQKESNNIWISFFDNDEDPNNNKPIKTIILDKNNIVLSEYDNYLPEQPFIEMENNKYNLLSSNYDEKSQILYRTYDYSKLIEKSISNEITDTTNNEILDKKDSNNIGNETSNNLNNNSSKTIDKETKQSSNISDKNTTDLTVETPLKSEDTTKTIKPIETKKETETKVETFKNTEQNNKTDGKKIPQTNSYISVWGLILSSLTTFILYKKKKV